MVAGEHLARPAHPALNLIDYKQNSMLVANSSKALEKVLWGRDITALTLNRFDDDCCNFRGRRCSFEQSLLDPVQCALTSAAIAARSK